MGQFDGVESDWQSINTEPLPETIDLWLVHFKQMELAKSGCLAANASAALSFSACWLFHAEFSSLVGCVFMLKGFGSAKLRLICVLVLLWWDRQAKNALDTFA